MPISINAMLMVIHHGPSIERRYRSVISNHASDHHTLTREVPSHQSCPAVSDVDWFMKGLAEIALTCLRRIAAITRRRRCRPSQKTVFGH